MIQKVLRCTLGIFSGNIYFDIANKPDPRVWLVCNIKINVSAEYTQGAAEDLLNQKLSLSSHIHRSL